MDKSMNDGGAVLTTERAPLGQGVKEPRACAETAAAGQLSLSQLRGTWGASIKQIHIASYLRNGFYRAIMSRYPELVEYFDPTQPCIFYGMYEDEQYNLLFQHRSLAVIVWTGGDIDIRRVKTKYRVMRLRELGHVRHMAISRFIANDLTKLKMPYQRLPFMGIDFNIFQPTAKGPCVYIYSTPGNESTYGKALYEEVVKRMPDLQFLMYCHHKSPMLHRHPHFQTCQTPSELAGVYARCFVGLRLTEHDGLAATVIELGCMGIKCLHNGDSPSSLNYGSVDDIVRLIRQEQQTVGTTDLQLAQRVRQYVDIGHDWLHVVRWI